MRLVSSGSRGTTAALAAALAIGACACPRGEKPVAPEGIALLTAFEPFGGLTTNTSLEVARRLDGAAVEGLRVTVVELPVVWEEARARIAAAVAELQPDIVICTGVGWSGRIAVETTARNRRGPHPDKLKTLPPRRTVYEGDPAGLRSRLPVEAIVGRLRDLGLPARLSDDAGEYLCNEAFYAALRETAGRSIPAGFIHLPRAGPDGARQETPGERDAGQAMPDGRQVTVAQLVEGIRAALELTARARVGTPSGTAAQHEECLSDRAEARR